MKQKDTEIAGLMKPGAKEKAIAEKMKKLEGRAQVTAEDNKKYVKMLADAEAQMWDSPVSKQEEELQKQVKQLKEENIKLSTDIKTNETQFQKETEKGKLILQDKSKEVEVRLLHELDT